VSSSLGLPKIVQTMNVTIEIDMPRLLPLLMAGLQAAGCAVEAVNSRACRVVNPADVEEDVVVRELWFYARAWALQFDDVAVHVRREP
jgi:hypothetical protein